MKPTLPLIALMLYASVSLAQIAPFSPWTWMKGDNTTEQYGVYGTQCQTTISNKPGARSIASTWRDHSGNLWLFGGMGLGSNQSGFLNDLWKFNPLTNKWVWMKGDTNPNQYSSYGIRETSNPSNKPGGTYSGISWVDNAGNFWLFGGYGYSENGVGLLNSLWKYSPSSNEWVWVNGSKNIDELATYGTKGIPDLSNMPGARYSSQSWTDANGDLWLFGGYGYGQSSFGELNDIWKYTISTNQWTWIKGDSTVSNMGSYGIKGVSAAENNPGSRYLGNSWKDHTGNIWLFGGYGYDENSLGSLNDLWKYDPSTNEWTWISGDKTIDQGGLYGTQGVTNSTNKPGARYISSSWKDVNGDLWVYGGCGYDSTNSGYLNDLWKYSPANDKWTWVKGDKTVDQPGVYGIQGMPDTLNKSGARIGSVSWSDENGNLWLFGGYGFDGTNSGTLNDLWKISSLMIPLPLKLLNFTGSLNSKVVNLQWQSEQETVFSHFNIQRSFDGVNFNTIGKIDGIGNSWNNYRFPDDLQNHQEHKVFYRLQLIDKDGTFDYSKILVFDLKQSTTIFKVFPNPAVHLINLSFAQEKSEKVSIIITDMKGVSIRKQVENISAGRVSTSIDVLSLPSGTYIISVIKESGTIQQKFIKQ